MIQPIGFKMGLPQCVEGTWHDVSGRCGKRQSSVVSEMPPPIYVHTVNYPTIHIQMLCNSDIFCKFRYNRWGKVSSIYSSHEFRYSIHSVYCSDKLRSMSIYSKPSVALAVSQFTNTPVDNSQDMQPAARLAFTSKHLTDHSLSSLHSFKAL